MYCLWLLFGLISLNLLGISLTSLRCRWFVRGYGRHADHHRNFISGLILLLTGHAAET